MVEKIRKIEIDWNTLDNLLGYSCSYDKRTDTLLIQTNEKRPAVSVDCDGDLWMRVDPETGEILGVEIEDFKKIFLKKYAKIFKEEKVYTRPVTQIIQMEKCPV